MGGKAITETDLFAALDRLALGLPGRFHDLARRHYVLDPRDDTLWDLKPVVGLAMELAGLPVSVGEDRGQFSSERLSKRLQSDLPEIVQVSFTALHHRRLGLGRADPTLPEPDWSDAEAEEKGIALPLLPPLAPGAPPRYAVTTLRYLRDPAVRDHALKQAAGHCGDCGQAAPFQRASGEPFLEVHHIAPLSRGGLDVIGNVIALCPNCHRKRHHGPGGLDA